MKLLLLLPLPVCLLLVQCAMPGPSGPWQAAAEGGSAAPPPRWDSGYYDRYRVPPGVSQQAAAAPGHRFSSPQSRPGPRVPFPMDGSLTESSTGNRTWRDRYSGEITGSEWTSPAGTTTYRSASGEILGSSDESPAGTRTYRNGSGEIVQTSSTTQGTGGDQTTTFRRNGSIVGTKYISPAGNVTWRDGSGRIVDGPGGMRP